MTDSATNVSESESKKVGESPGEILDRLEQYKEDNPNCVEYWIDTEIEAACLLLAMAASLKHLETDVNYDKASADCLRHYADQYRQSVQQGKAINYLRNLSDSDALCIWGMRIRARKIITH